MAMKSVILAAGLMLGSVHAITTEGMLAAPRRSTGTLSAKGVSIALYLSSACADKTGSSIVFGNEVQLDYSKVDVYLVLPRHQDRQHYKSAFWKCRV
jgi:hypothetical protein